LTKRDLSIWSLESRIENENRHHTEDITWFGNRDVDHIEEIEEASCPEGNVKVIRTEEIESQEYVDGYAYIRGTNIVLRLPKKVEKIDLSFEIAWVFWHELYHIYGIRSHRIVPKPNIIKEQVEWARGIPIFQKEEKQSLELCVTS